MMSSASLTGSVRVRAGKYNLKPDRRPRWFRRLQGWPLRSQCDGGTGASGCWRKFVDEGGSGDGGGYAIRRSWPPRRAALPSAGQGKCVQTSRNWPGNSCEKGNRLARLPGPSTSTPRRFTASSRDRGLMPVFCSSQPHRPIVRPQPATLATFREGRPESSSGWPYPGLRE